MGKIRASDKAPATDLNFVLGNSDFELAQGATYETDDPATISSARSHPWLVVEDDVTDTVEYNTEDRQVKPEDDALSVQNSVAFDPEEIRKVEEDKRVVYGTPTAIDAGLDQNEAVYVGDVAVTVAADNESDDEVVVGPVPTDTPSAPVLGSRSDFNTSDDGDDQ